MLKYKKVALIVSILCMVLLSSCVSQTDISKTELKDSTEISVIDFSYITSLGFDGMTTARATNNIAKFLGKKFNWTSLLEDVTITDKLYTLNIADRNDGKHTWIHITATGNEKTDMEKLLKLKSGVEISITGTLVDATYTQNPDTSYMTFYDCYYVLKDCVINTQK